MLTKFSQTGFMQCSGEDDFSSIEQVEESLQNSFGDRILNEINHTDTASKTKSCTSESIDTQTYTPRALVTLNERVSEAMKHTHFRQLSVRRRRVAVCLAHNFIHLLTTAFSCNVQVLS